MQWIDIVIGLLLVGFVGAGWKDGLVPTVGRLLGTIVGFVAARAWHPLVSPWIDLIAPTPWARVMGFILVFVVVTRLIGFLFKLVDGVIRVISWLPFLASINALLGAIGGLAEGFILLGGVIYMIHQFGSDTSPAVWIQKSDLAPLLRSLFQSALRILL